MMLKGVPEFDRLNLEKPSTKMPSIERPSAERPNTERLTTKRSPPRGPPPRTPLPRGRPLRGHLPMDLHQGVEQQGADRTGNIHLEADFEIPAPT